MNVSNSHPKQLNAKLQVVLSGLEALHYDFERNHSLYRNWTKKELKRYAAEINAIADSIIEIGATHDNKNN
jgi:hypothetical protein